MNLLDDLARAFAPAAAPERLHQDRARLPGAMLRRHAEANRACAARGDEADALAAALDATPAASANPELYPSLVLLRFAPAHLLDALFDRIRWHAGLAGTLGAGLADGWYRSFREPAVQEARGGALAAVEGCCAPARCGVRVYLPRPGLFRDLLGADLYPDAPSTRGDADLRDDVDRAWDLVRRYDAELHDDVRRCFNVLVLTTDFGTVRSSFNLRLRYVGGLFLNPFHETPLGLAEGLVHEYYHQRLWHWWWNEPLDGLPGEGVLVRSPLTGRERPVPVMTHALVVYIAVAGLLGTLADRLDGADERAAAAARAGQVRAGIGPLGRALQAAVVPGSRAAELVDLVVGLGSRVDAGRKLA